MPKQSHLDPALEAKLKSLRLRLEMPDHETLLLKNVPAKRYFSKAHTNLLIKRFDNSLACVVCVDENLNYLGPDADLVRAFSASPRKNGWRILTLGGSLADAETDRRFRLVRRRGKELHERGADRQMDSVMSGRPKGGNAGPKRSWGAPVRPRGQWVRPARAGACGGWPD